jgi:hypothetical protein
MAQWRRKCRKWPISELARWPRATLGRKQNSDVVFQPLSAMIVRTAHFRLVEDRRAAFDRGHNMDRVIKVPFVAISGLSLCCSAWPPRSAPQWRARTVTPESRLVQANGAGQRRRQRLKARGHRWGQPRLQRKSAPRSVVSDNAGGRKLVRPPFYLDCVPSHCGVFRFGRIDVSYSTSCGNPSRLRSV